jgi:hypothetical protein
MSDQPHYEKDEKNEKEDEKVEEKTVEEKYRRDPLSAIIWALILIWAGLVFLADNMGMLASFRLPAGVVPGAGFIHPEAWSVIFVGGGVILLAEVVIRLLVPIYRQPVGGTIFLAAVFLGIGLGNIFGWNVVWPLILIALGLSVLLRGAWRRP